MSSGGDDLTEHVIPSAAVALAWVYLQRGDMREAHAQLKLAESRPADLPGQAGERARLRGRGAARLGRGAGHGRGGDDPPRARGMVAVAARLARGQAGDSRVARAGRRRAMSRRPWPRRSAPTPGPEAAAALAHAWLAAGDEQAARRVLGTRRPGVRRNSRAGAGRSPAQLRHRGRRARSSLSGARAAASQARADEAALRHGDEPGCGRSCDATPSWPAPIANCSSPI